MKVKKNNALPFAEKEAHDSTGLLLWQLTTTWQRAITAVLRPHGLTQVQFVLLASLLWLASKEKCITQVMLATHTKLDVMMTSQVLRTLESRSLVVRHAHPTDTRARMLKLTLAGKKLAMRTVPVVEEVDHHFFSALGKQRKDFNHQLRGLITND